MTHRADQSSSEIQPTPAPRVATTHQLANRAVLTSAARLGDIALVGVVVLGARFLGTERFGLFMFGLTLATVIVVPVLESFIPMMTKSAARHPLRVGGEVGSLIMLQVALLAGLLGLGWGALHMAHISAARQQMVLIMGLALGVRGPLEVMRSAFRGLGRFDTELKVTIVERSLLLCSAAVVLCGGGGPYALGACFIVARLLAMAYALRWFDRLGHTMEWYARTWSHHLKEATPYGFTKWIYSLFDQVGTLCIAWLLSDAATGIYSAAFRLFDGASALPQVLVLVLLPEVTVRSHLAPSRIAPLVRRAAAYMALVALPLTAGLLVEGRWFIAQVYGTGYSGAATALRVLAVAILFAFTSEIARATLWALDRQRTVLTIIAGGLLMNAFLCLWLVPRYAATGAALAALASNIVVWVAMWRVLAREGVAWPWVDAVVKPGLVALAAAGTLMGLHGMYWPVRFLAAGLVALCALVATKSVTPLEWSVVRSLPGRLVPHH